MKEAVKHASTTIRKEIKANALENTGKYAKSWTVKYNLKNAHYALLTIAEDGTESRNDDCKYAQIATQEDFDRF